MMTSRHMTEHERLASAKYNGELVQRLSSATGAGAGSAAAAAAAGANNYSRASASRVSSSKIPEQVYLQVGGGQQAHNQAPRRSSFRQNEKFFSQAQAMGVADRDHSRVNANQTLEESKFALSAIPVEDEAGGLTLEEEVLHQVLNENRVNGGNGVGIGNAGIGNDAQRVRPSYVTQVQVVP